MVSHASKVGSYEHAGTEAGAARRASLRRRGAPMDPSSNKAGAESRRLNVEDPSMKTRVRVYFR